jgi:hypothetical protein
MICPTAMCKQDAIVPLLLKECLASTTHKGRVHRLCCLSADGKHTMLAPSWQPREFKRCVSQGFSWSRNKWTISLSVFLSRSYIRFDRSRNSGDRVFCLKTRFQTHRLCRTKMLNERRLVALRQPHGNGLDHSKPCWILNVEHQSSVQMDVMILPK